MLAALKDADGSVTAEELAAMFAKSTGKEPLTPAPRIIRHRPASGPCHPQGERGESARAEPLVAGFRPRALKRSRNCSRRWPRSGKRGACAAGSIRARIGQVVVDLSLNVRQRIQRLELDSRVRCGESPVRAAGEGVSLPLPGRNFGVHCGCRREATVSQALP